jgi:hypothetical protein
MPPPAVVEHLDASMAIGAPPRAQQQIAGARMHLQHAAEGADQQVLPVWSNATADGAHRADRHAVAVAPASHVY